MDQTHDVVIASHCYHWEKMWICFMCSACFQFSGMQRNRRFKMLFISKLRYCEKLTKLWFVHCYEQLFVAVVFSWHSMITWWQTAMCRFLHKIKQDGYKAFPNLQKRRRDKGLPEFLMRTEWTHLCNISLSCPIIKVKLDWAFYEAVYLNENINLIIKRGTATSSC